MNNYIILNRIKTPDGTILTSYSVHDYKEHKDLVIGEVYTVDGGTKYIRRSANKVPYIEMSIYSDEPFEIIRENFHRGTWDNQGNRVWKKMSEMSDDHLLNCINYNIKLGLPKDCFANQMYKKELDYRIENNIYLKDMKEKVK